VERAEDRRDRRGHARDLVGRDGRAEGGACDPSGDDVERRGPDPDAAVWMVEVRIDDRDAREIPRDGDRPAKVPVAIGREETEAPARGRGSGKEPDREGEGDEREDDASVAESTRPVPRHGGKGSRDAPVESP